MRIIAIFSCLCCLILTGCESIFPVPRPSTFISMWHCYGAQADSPMNKLVQEFNETEGKKYGITVTVTSISNSTAMHFPLVATATGKPGNGPMPDIFVAYPKTVLAIGPERFMDWKTHLNEEELSAYVSSFLDEGSFDDRLIILPLAKSSSCLFINSTIFDKFAEERKITYDDLRTWEGMFRVARDYYKWSGGKAFFKYDDWLHYSMVNTASFGGSLFREDKVDFTEPHFKKIWKMLAAAVAGDVCLLDGYSTTAMMTGETICGIESSASILYFKDRVTFPDNTQEPFLLRILPVPHFLEAKAIAIQRGSGLCALSNSPEKEKAIALFATWLTQPQKNIPFTISAGYFPVKKESYELFLIQIS